MKEAQNESRDNDLGCRNSMDVCAEGTEHVHSESGRVSKQMCFSGFLLF